MKIIKKPIIRFVIIGTFHAAVFLWLIPFVILPRFGAEDSGRALSVVVTLTVVISAAILFYPVYKRQKKTEGKSSN